MSYLLASTIIKRPSAIKENNSTQVAQNRVLSGAVGRDYFGSNKKIWTLNYSNCNPTDFATIKTIYDNYLSSGSAVAFQSTESNYTISLTNVHVDLLERDFSVKGSSYLSDFDLILTEA